MATSVGTKPYIIEVDPREILAGNAQPDANIRTDLGDLAELAASVADDEVGMVEFPMLTPREDGSLRLVAGFRRLTAAVEAELPTVTCVVRPEWADKPQSVLIAMIKENTQRKDLTVKEEADAYAQLMLFEGMTVEKIVRATGRKRDYVEGQLAVAKLNNAEAVKLANQGRLTLEDATALDEFADQPKIQARIVKKIGDTTRIGTWGGQHVINTEKAKKTHRITAAQRIQELRLAGASILPKKPKDFGYNSRETDVENLRDAEGNTLDGDTLVFQPGFAALLDSNQGFPVVRVVCLDPEKHGYARIGHHSYVSPQAQADQARHDAEQAARIETLKAAEEVRHNFLAKTYGNTKSKAAKAMLALALRQAAHDPSRLSIGHGAGPLVTRIAATDPDTIDTTTSVERVNRVLIARYVLSREADLVMAMRWGDRAETALKWQDLLVSDGYELSDAENALRDKLLDRLKPAPEPRTTTSDLTKPCNECDADVDEECEEECELFHAEPDDQEPDDQDAALADPDAAQAEPQPGDEQAEPDQ